MALHKIELSRGAQRVYLRLFERDRSLFDRIRAGLEAISRDPRSGKALKGEHFGRWSFRIGQYRVIYRVDDGRLVVIVLDMGHRREIYR